MPKYTFLCKCGNRVQSFTSSKINTINCEVCHATMNRLMPVLNGKVSVNEVVDKYTGITWIDEQQDLVKQRRDDHYWAVEVPRFVASGIYSIETMLENGWIYVDDNDKVRVNDKPINRR